MGLLLRGNYPPLYARGVKIVKTGKSQNFYTRLKTIKTYCTFGALLSGYCMHCQVSQCTVLVAVHVIDCRSSSVFPRREQRYQRRSRWSHWRDSAERIVSTCRGCTRCCRNVWVRGLLLEQFREYGERPHEVSQWSHRLLDGGRPRSPAIAFLARRVVKMRECVTRHCKRSIPFYIACNPCSDVLALVPIQLPMH